MGSVIVAPGLWSPGIVTSLHLNAWSLSGPGMNPCLLALAGRFFTAEPPGKPSRLLVSMPFKAFPAVPSLSRVRLFATLWTVARQAPPSAGFLQARINTGVGSHFLLRGIFPHLGMEPTSPALAGGIFTAEPPGKPSFFNM